ncbi:putative reverse transcriptase domain-containing protein [Tanacetum coccineum]
MPPKRTYATTARAAAATARAVATVAAAAPMITIVVEKLIKARVSEDFLNCKPSTFMGTEGVVVLSQWFEKMDSVFHISNCVVENQVKFATCTFLGNALTWWNSHMKDATQDVAYVMDKKTMKKMMTVKYYPRGEIKKLEIKLYNLKVKGTDVASYTLCFQALVLMCGRMFYEESEEVEKYVGGLLDMIRGNVCHINPRRWKKQLSLLTTRWIKKSSLLLKDIEQKRNEKMEYMGSLPLCIKCNSHHKGPCAPRCNEYNKIGHLARDCRSSGPNGNNNNRGNSGTTRNVVTAMQCGV